MKKLFLLSVTILCNVMMAVAQCVTPSLTSASTGAAICTGDTLNLFANGPANVTGYSWTGPNSFTSTLQNPAIPGAGTSATGTYTVVVVNGVGTCSATYTVGAIVNASPVSSYVTSQSPLCLGSQLVISPATAWCYPFALGCNGVNSMTSAAAPISTATNNITMEAWVLWNGDGNEMILDNGNAASDGYGLQIIDGSGALNVVLFGVEYMSSSAHLQAGVRQHVAVVCNAAGTWSVYVNGVQYAVSGATRVANTPTTGFYIGNNGGGTNPFDGYIGNVAFWTVARSAAQIQADMDACTQAPTAGLAGYWALGDGAGTVVADASGNGNTLSLSNTTWHATLVSGAYSWNFGDGTSTATGSAPAHTYTASGTYTVSITSSGCSGPATKAVTIESPLIINAISGTASICVGATAALGDVTTGGAWSSGATGVATVDSTGIVTGVAAGTAIISYTKTNSCGTAAVTTVATVNALPAAGSISGAGTVCISSNITLSDATSGGAWSSSNTAAATISTAGAVTGIGAGTTIISYTVFNSLCASSATSVVTVSAPAAAGSISGAPDVCNGSFVSFYDAVSGGVWGSSNTAIAAVDASGNVAGEAAGTATISYSVNTCGTAVAVKDIIVVALPVASFTTLPPGTPCVGAPATYTTQSGLPQYIWSISGTSGADYTVTGGGTDTSNSITLQWLTQGSGVVSVNYTDTNGCSSGISNTSGIAGAPVGPFNILSTPSCTGSPVTIIAQGATCGPQVYATSGDNYAVTYYLEPYTDNLTMEAWINWQGNGGHPDFGNAFISGGPDEGNGYAMYIGDDGRLAINVFGVATLSSDAYIVWGTRSHVAIVRNSGIWSLYLNGVQYGVTNNTASPYTPTLYFQIGIDGTMSNVAFWTMPRSTAQIRGDMNSCSLAPQTGLEAYWAINGMDASDASFGRILIADASGHGHPLYISPALSGWVNLPSSSGYIWDFGDGGTEAGPAPTHTYAANGTYTVNVTNAACGGSASMVVNVIDTLPAVPAISGAASVCAGITTTLSDSMGGGIWLSANTAVATISTGGMLSALVPGTATISYMAGNACGTAVATKIVTVNATSVVFTAIPAAQLCSGNVATYAAPAGQSGYTWGIPGAAGTDYTIAGGGTGTASDSVSLKWLTPGSKTVSINYTGSNGCAAAAPASDTTVVIYPNPSFTVTPNPVCAGAPVNFSPATQNGCALPVLMFNGTTSAASIATPITNATDNITIEAWVQWNGGGSQMIFVNGNTGGTGYALVVSNSGGALSIDLGFGPLLTSAATLTPGVKAHVAIVRKLGTWSIYLNGVQYAVSSPTNAPNIPNTGFYVGCCSYPVQVFNGSISKVAFWSVGRSTIQVQADMNSCQLLPQAELIGYWTLGDGGGTVANDGSGYGHNLALSNTAWSAGGISYTYLWSYGDGGTSTAANPVYTYTASGTDSASLTLTSSTGCSATATVSVNVPAAAPVAGPITGASFLCTGGTALLSDTSGGAGVVWSSADTSVLTIGTSGTINGIAAGTALISYVTTNACGSNLATTVVSVDPIPSVTFTAVPPPSVCVNTAVTYATQAGQTNYEWNIAGTAGIDYMITAGDTSSSNDLTLEWLTAGSKMVSVDYMSVRGCSSSGAAANTTTVHALPYAHYNVDATPICLGNATHVTLSDGCGSALLLNFDGTASNATAGAPVSYATDNITIEAWVQWNGGGNQMIFANGNTGANGYALMVTDTSGTLGINIGAVALLTSAATLAPGIRTHVAIVRTAGTWFVYRNGEQFPVSDPGASPYYMSSPTFYVGTCGYPGQVFNGHISNLNFWVLARSTPQIQADMLNCTFVPQAGLAGCWPMNEGAGTTAHDASGLGNDLTLAGTTWTTIAVAGDTYSWSFGDGSASTLIAPAYTYTAPGIYTTSIAVNDTYGCSATDTATVTVNTPIGGPIMGNAALCQGAAMALSDAGAGGIWSSTDTSVAPVSSSGAVLGNSGGTATISYVINNGCITTATTVVTVDAVIPVFTSGPTLACVNTPVTYATLPGETNYTWTISGVPGTDYTITAGGTSSSDSLTVEWLSGYSQTINVKYTTPSGCTAVAGTTETIMMTALPDVRYATDPGQPCVNSATTFNGYDGWCYPNVVSYSGSDYVNNENVVPMEPQFTFESWVQWDGPDSRPDQGIFSVTQGGSYGYGLGITATGKLEVLVQGRPTFLLPSSAALVTNQRAHVALTYSYANGWTIYLNGVAYPVPTSATTPDFGSGVPEFYVGYQYITRSGFKGLIANASYWSAARDANIATDMDSCSFSPQPTLDGYWPMNEGSGATCYDASGNGRDMTAVAGWQNTTVLNSYTWSFGDGSAGTGSTPVHTYSVAGVYTVALTAANTSGCVASATNQLTVNALPTLAGASGSLACAGGTLSLFANTPSNVSSYSWAGPGFFSATDQNPSITGATAEASGTYTVTVYNGSMACAASYTTSATVNAAPSLDSASAPSLVCIGTNMNLVANTPAYVTGYLWAGPGSFSATTMSPTVSGITTAAAGIYSVTVSNGSGSGCTVSYTTAQVQVGTVPVIGPINGAATTCMGATSTLSDTTAGGYWFSIDETIATISATGTVTGLSVGATSIAYAVSNMCGINTRFTPFTVNTGAAPITGTANMCAGASVTLSDATTGGAWVSGATGIATAGPTGIVTGVAAGTASISYTVINSCGTATVTSVVTVNATSAGAITGTATVCQGATITLIDATTGGAWSSSNTGVATAGSTGIVRGIAAGTVTISYTGSGTCGSASATAIVTVNALPTVGLITGTTTLCTGTTATLADATTGGVWSSSATSIATAGSTGIMRGIASGTAIISYTKVNGCGSVSATAMITVSTMPATPAAITGTKTECAGSTTTLADVATGGAWSSSNTGIATVGSTGIVNGLAGGTATISYAKSNSCGSAAVTAIVTVNPLPTVAAVTGSGTVCAGSTTTLADAITGGAWSSSATSIAAAGSTGIIRGITSGTAIISYTKANGCGSVSATAMITVGIMPAAPAAITGTKTVCAGSTTALTDEVAGGTWSSSNTGIATVGSTGTVYGASSGTAVISYIKSTACASASVTAIVTINALPAVAAITGAATLCGSGTTTLADATAGGVWSSGNTGIATVSTGGVVHGVTSGSVVISYTVTNSHGCVSTVTDAVKADPAYTITASAGAGGSISPSGTTTVCSGSSQAYAITASSGYTIASVVIDGVSTAAVSSYTFSAVARNHTISASFMSKSKGGRTAGTGGEETPGVINELTVSAFPNPYSSEIRIKIQSAGMDNVDVLVYDVTGRLKETKLNQPVETEIAVGENYAPGIYIIEVKQGDQSKKIKIVKIN